MFGKSKAPGTEFTRSAPEAGQGAAPRSGAYAPPGVRRGEQRTPAPGVTGRAAGPERQLVVGREISLAGEIKACETLVVEGKVEADLRDCKALRISVSGLYKGAATVAQADIAGHFDGELTVTGTLVLRSTGRVSGSLRYGEMEIERGGKVSGSLQDIPPPGKPTAKPAETKSAPGTAQEPAARQPAPAPPKAATPDDLVTRAQSNGPAS